MTATITTRQDFESKMMDRIRSSIGELLTDDELKAIVHKGVENALFSPRTEERPRTWGGSDTVTKPPFVEEAVMSLLRERMAVEVDKWVKANPEKMESVIRDVMRDGVAGCVLKAVDARFSGMLEMLVGQMQAAGMIRKRDDGGNY